MCRKNMGASKTGICTHCLCNAYQVLGVTAVRLVESEFKTQGVPVVAQQVKNLT